MPWNLADAMKERTKLIGDYLSGNYGPAELARRYGISRKSVYKWIQRYELEGAAGLHEKFRAPHHQAHAISQEVIDALLKLKQQWPRWGAPKLLARLQRDLGPLHCPAESTVSAVLKRHGLSFARKPKRHATPGSQPLQHATGSNAVWCIDFKGWFRTGAQKVLPI